MREQKFFCSIILTQQPSEFPVLCFNTHHLKKKRAIQRVHVLLQTSQKIFNCALLKYVQCLKKSSLRIHWPGLLFLLICQTALILCKSQPLALLGSRRLVFKIKLFDRILLKIRFLLWFGYKLSHLYFIETERTEAFCFCAAWSTCFELALARLTPLNDSIDFKGSPRMRKVSSRDWMLVLLFHPTQIHFLGSVILLDEWEVQLKNWA